MHLFNAPVMASGKSLLADVVAMMATGHPATVMSYTPDGDEMRKRILSVLLQGDLVVNLDNVEEPLSSQTLCTVLTQESIYRPDSGREQDRHRAHLVLLDSDRE